MSAMDFMFPPKVSQVQRYKIPHKILIWLTTSCAMSLEKDVHKENSGSDAC